MTPEDQAAFDALIATHEMDPDFFFDIRYTCDGLVKWRISRYWRESPHEAVATTYGQTFHEAVHMALQEHDGMEHAT